MDVCVHMCVRTQASICRVWRQEEDAGSPLFLPTIFPWTKAFHETVEYGGPLLAFYMGARGLNPGPHACAKPFYSWNHPSGHHSRFFFRHREHSNVIH